MKVLLNFDADPNLTNDKGITSIDICKDNKILKLLTATEADIEKPHVGSKEREDGGEAKREEEPEKCPEVEIKTGAESTPPPSSPKTETDDVSDMDTEQVFHKAKQEVTTMSSPPNSGPLNLENVPRSAGTSGTAVGRKGARGRPRGRRTKGGFYSDISSSESESDYFEAGSKRRRRKELLVERQTQRPLEGVSESQEETDEDVEMGIGVREEGKDKAEKSEKMEGVGMVAKGTGKDEQGIIVKEKNEAEKDEEKEGEKDEEKEGEKEEEKEGEKDEEKEEEEKTLDEHHEIGTVKSDSGQEPKLKKEPDEMKEMEGSSETPSSRLFYCVWIHCVCIIMLLCSYFVHRSCSREERQWDRVRGKSRSCRIPHEVVRQQT